MNIHIHKYEYRYIDMYASNKDCCANETKTSNWSGMFYSW